MNKHWIQLGLCGLLGPALPGFAPLAGASPRPGLGPGAPAGASLARRMQPSHADGPSLEAWLAELRRERDARFAAFDERVLRVVTELEELPLGRRADAAGALRAQLLELGTEAAPLLVSWLEPGSQADDAQRFRASQMARVLRELPTSAVTDPLLALLLDGSSDARSNALVALASTPEPQRARPVVVELFRSANGELRREALSVLAALGADDELFREALRDSDADTVAMALRSLAQSRRATLAPAVVELLRNTGGKYVVTALRFFEAVPERFDEEAAKVIASALASPQVHTDDKTEALERLARMDIDIDSGVRKSLEPLSESSSKAVREAALVLLAKHGDRRARRVLLEPYDEAISRTRSRATPYDNRAEILYRIGDLRGAIKDYRRSLDVGENRSVNEVPYLGLARCFARQGKFREAADYLDKAPVSLATLQELAKEPAFAEMVADERYRRSFHLPTEK